jgi:cob(I)alamin adenosyltransferase
LRVEAYGVCDELNVAIGAVKPVMKELVSQHPYLSTVLERFQEIQKDLIVLMGELATLPEDRERYLKGGHHLIGADEVARLLRWVDELEGEGISYDGWATPGASSLSVALDTARVTCRRAERRVCELGKEVQTFHRDPLKYLNRLSDILWLLARKVDSTK